MAEEESFKVTDRRGREREFVSAETTPSVASAQPPSAAPAGVRREREGQALGGPAADRGPVDLQGLFVMFASSALINLGEAPDPMSGERQVDLDQAKEAIDLLLLLREKTEGNRTEHESRLLEQILYDVQMRFVQATRGSARA